MGWRLNTNSTKTPNRTDDRPAFWRSFLFEHLDNSSPPTSRTRTHIIGVAIDFTTGKGFLLRRIHWSILVISDRSSVVNTSIFRSISNASFRCCFA